MPRESHVPVIIFVPKVTLHHHFCNVDYRKNRSSFRATLLRSKLQTMLPDVLGPLYKKGGLPLYPITRVVNDSSALQGKNLSLWQKGFPT